MTASPGDHPFPRTLNDVTALRDRWIAGAAFLGALLFHAAWVGFEVWLPHDNAIYLYTGRRLVEGVPPFESIFTIKTPLASFLSATGIKLGSYLGVPPLYAARGVFAVAAASVAGGFYLILRRIVASKHTALLGSFLILTVESWLIYIASGPRPKVLATVLILWMLYGVLRGRWILAGAMAGLSVLAWQPCLLAAVSILGSILVLDRESRRRATVKYLSGALIPVTLVALYFVAFDAWDSFLSGSLGIHLSHVRGRAQDNPLIGLMVIFKRAWPMWMFLWIGNAVTLVTALRAATSDHSPDRVFWASLVGMIVLFTGFSLMDFQSSTDAFVLLPSAVIGLAILFDRWFESLSESGSQWSQAAFLTVFMGVLVTALLTGLQSKVAWGSLSWERDVIAEIREEVGEQRRATVVGAPQVLALTGWPSRTPFVIIDSGIDLFIDDRYPTGFRGWMTDTLCGPEEVLVTGKLLGPLITTDFQEAIRRTYEPIQRFPSWPEHDLTIWRRSVDRSTCWQRMAVKS